MNVLRSVGPGALRVLALISLGIIVLAGIVRLPQQWRLFVEPALPVVQLWSDAEAQHRLQYADAPFDLLRAAEATLPSDAAVLLVTSGEDVRGAEYRTFHRALYLLAPRPVWWLTPAQPDDTWESNWWISAPINGETVQQTAVDRGAHYVLVSGVSALALTGRRLVERNDGYLLQLDQTGPLPVAPPVAPLQASVAWPLRLAVALLTIWAVGDALLALTVTLNKRGGCSWTGPLGVEALAMTWILGCGFTSLAMLGLNQLRMRLGVQVVAVAALALAWVGYRLWRRIRRPVLPAYRSRFGSSATAANRALNLLLIAVVALQLLLSGLLAVGQPLAGWDSWSSWGMRARTIFLENGITPAVYADASRVSTQPGYPLLTPLVQAYIYRWLGAADDRLAGAVIWLFFASLLGLIYGAVWRRSHDQMMALLAATAAASIPWLVALSGLTYVDVALATLVTAAAIYLIDWLATESPGALVLATAVLALMAWTKNEGLVLAAVLMVAALTAYPPWKNRRGWIAAIAGSSAALAVAVAWRLVATGAPAAAAFLPLQPATLLANLGRIVTIERIVRSILTSADFALVWSVALIFGIGTLLLPASQRRAAWTPDTTLLPMAAALYLAIMSTTYLFSAFQPYQQHIMSSFYRLATQVAPLVVLWIAYAGGGMKNDTIDAAAVNRLLHFRFLDR